MKIINELKNNNNYNEFVEKKAFELASDDFWDNYAERMTCAAEDRYDYLNDR